MRAPPACLPAPRALTLPPSLACPAGTILEQTRSLQNMLQDEERDFADDVVWAAV